MSDQLQPNPKQQFFDSNGIPLVGGELYSYQAGTLIPLKTFVDPSGNTPCTNPIILDSTGSANVWIGAGGYKFVLKDASGNTLWTVDNVYAVNPASVDKTKITSSIVNLGLSRNGAGSIDVQVDNDTVEINGSNQVKVKNLTASKLSSLLEVIFQNVRDFGCPGAFQMVPQYDWTSPTLIDAPVSLPLGGGRSIKRAPYGPFLALAIGNTSPYLYIYETDNGLLTKLSEPGTMPTGEVKEIDFSPGGDFLAVAHTTSPYITVFLRAGVQKSNLSSTIPDFDKMTDPVTLPAANGVSCAFAPNSDFLAVASSDDSFILYARVSTPVDHGAGILFIQTLWTDITATSTITGVSRIVRWSADSSLFAAINTSTGNIAVYTRANNVFTSITGPSMSSYSNDVVDFAFSPDRNFLAVAVNISPYILIFQMTGNVFSQLPNPSTLPAGIPNSLRWSLNSQYLVVGHASSPFMTIYGVSGTTFTKQSDPSDLPAAAVRSADWSPTKQYLSVVTAVSPFIQTYETASILSSNAIPWTREAPNV